jgi:hypothetical protein
MEPCHQGSMIFKHRNSIFTPNVNKIYTQTLDKIIQSLYNILYPINRNL